MNSSAPLSDRMRALAAGQPAHAAELIAAADNLDSVCADARATAPRLIGAWARARTLFCRISGEALV